MEMILWCVLALCLLIAGVYLYFTQLGKGLRPRNLRECVNLLRWSLYD